MRYAAFLSYSHADARWAQWLHRRLEAYRVPSRLVGTPGPDGPIGTRLGTIFRDRDELPTSGDLGATIKSALSESSALIVICSPAVARSRWANREVEAFQALGRGDRIACFVVAGDPASGGDDACFPPALLAPGPDGAPNEPLAADARPQGDGRDRAFLRLVAGLLGVSYDVLARREAQRRHRRMLAITVGALLGMAVAFGLAAAAYVARNDAQRRQAQAEDILGFMLGDLRTKLTTVGRLDLMRAVDDKATSYFATLQPRDLSDRALEEQARSLTGIGQVRLDEGHHEQAMAAFREAYERSRALSERQPDNGQRLFDRAQAEYWIGLVFWRKNQFDDAETWLRRYRDSALKLAAMDPANFDWQREVSYGHHNLAVLDQSRGHYKQAEQAFRAELNLYREWLKTHPQDTSLRDEAANAASFLGTLAQDDGRLSEAQARFQEQLDAVSRNRQAEPDNAIWKKTWLDARVLLAQVQAVQGKTTEARRGLDEATALAESLAAQDRNNREWQQIAGVCRLWQAKLAASSDPERAEGDARIAERVFTAAHAAEPDDARFLRSLTNSRLLLAQLALQRNDPGSASVLLSQAEADLKPAWIRKPNEELRQLVARTRYQQGQVAQARGDAKASMAAWTEAERLLRDGLGNPPAFNRLDLLVRVLQAQHRGAEAAPYRARLDKSGYVPLSPFRQSTAVASR
ncbi:TIR domain-containing protein [Cognatiluteimonas profundi]|uniref:TIR domain-containing protein n=1 Tax=Cognatiluteimonas profundi TaxID=2594501 RepID=UPI00131B3B28|nr:TIR domain-containing protein [Lysobacter profundi]